MSLENKTVEFYISNAFAFLEGYIYYKYAQYAFPLINGIVGEYLIKYPEKEYSRMFSFIFCMSTIGIIFPLSMIPRSLWDAYPFYVGRSIIFFWIPSIVIHASFYMYIKFKLK